MKFKERRNVIFEYEHNRRFEPDRKIISKEEKSLQIGDTMLRGCIHLTIRKKCVFYFFILIDFFFLINKLKKCAFTEFNAL